MAIDASRLGGVIIPMVTPLDEAHRLCEQDFISLLDFVCAPVVTGEIVAGVTVAAETGLPLIADINTMYGPCPSDELLAALFSLPSVAAVKDSTGDASFIDRILSARPEGKISIQTVERFSLSSVRAGIDGLMIGASNLLPKAALEVWAFGRLPDEASQALARAAQQRLFQAAKIYEIGAPFSKDWVVMKEALAAAGIIAQNARHPAPPYELLSDAERAAVAEAAQALTAGAKIA